LLKKLPKLQVEVNASQTKWLGGWGIPPCWALEVLANHAITNVQWLPPTFTNLQQADINAGYSLGASLLLRTDKAEEARLFAPFFDFKKEAGQGGRVAKAQLLYIRKWLKRDPIAALNDFYSAADLPLQITELPYDLDDLLWGIDQLLEDVSPPEKQVSANAFWGEKDSLLDPESLQKFFNSPTVIPIASHNLDELLP